jgi:uncharacterized membrane protein YvlD (DUF360 family)
VVKKMKRKIYFLIFWVINSLLLYLSTLAFPGNFVLGTYRYSVLVAAIISGFVWTLLLWISKPVQIRLKIKGELKKSVFFFGVNFVSLWLVARFAPYTGFGVTNFVYVLGLAATAEVVHSGIHWLVDIKLRLSKKL